VSSKTGLVPARRNAMPALLTIQSASASVRYATLMGIKKARPKKYAAFASDACRRRGAYRDARARLSAGEEEERRRDPVGSKVRPKRQRRKLVEKSLKFEGE